LFAKPIKWFKEMQELFFDSSAIGSFARDHITCLSDGNHADNDDSRDFIDLSCDAPSEDQADYDSDTLASPTTNGNVESSSYNSSKKCQRSKPSPSKRPSKTTSRIARCTNEITATMKSLREELAATSHTNVAMSYPQMQQQIDQHTTLW
jgi:hypothetical protein